MDNLARLLQTCAELVATCERFREQRERLRACTVPNTMASMMAGDDLPRWHRRLHAVQKTTYIRRDYNAGDVAILQKIASAQLDWTFDQVIRRKNEMRKR